MHSKTNNLKFNKLISFVLSFVMVISLLVFVPISKVCAAINPNYKTVVMAPLEDIKEWDTFDKQLITLKNNGIYAISTDIWWGKVEAKGDNQFDWSYYKTYASHVRKSGLKWVPIISTHQCGSIPNDIKHSDGEPNPSSIVVLIPDWLKTKGSEDEMEFKDELGEPSQLALSPWWKGTVNQYDELYASFAANFSEYKDVISKIYLSGGPSGELRYPSYSRDRYPTRGRLQAYTESAKNDFRNAMKNKYVTIEKVNKAWGTNLSSFSNINPPSDRDNFFVNGCKTNYGKDFLTWYEEVLINHLSKMSEKAHNRFDSVFNVPIGAKVAGIHWLMNSPTMPHAAEYCAGYYNYNTLLDQFKNSKLDLTFTCAEMDDSNANIQPMYSAPKSLVIQIANLANNKNIKINGENGLTIQNDPQKYQNVAEMMFNYNFSGFSLLRINNLVNNDGSPTSEMYNFKETVALKAVPVTFNVSNANVKNGENIYVTGSRWELGKWDTAFYPVKLNNNNGTYTAEVYLGEGKNYEFKAIKKDSKGNVVWEGGANNNFVVPNNGGKYSWNWKN